MISKPTVLTAKDLEAMGISPDSVFDEDPVRESLRESGTMAESAAEAKENGEARYLGPPCKYEHIGIRYTRSGECVSCVRGQGIRKRTKRRRLLSCQ